MVMLSLFRRRADKQITIQQPVMVGSIQKFQDWITVPAAIEPLTGVEQTGALDPTNVVTISVYIEFVTGVRPKMRVAYQSRVLEIISVVNLLEQNLILHLVTREATV